MINLLDFNLIYFRKEDERKFLVRLITKDDYVLIDTVTGDLLRMTLSVMRRRFRPCHRLNKLNKKRRPVMNFGRRRIA
jgi:hypothetical protein